MRPKPQGQVYIAKGSAPWHNDNSNTSYQWLDTNKIISTDESISGQATVTCKGVTNMGYMFYNCNKITSIDLSNFDTSNVKDMNHMFNFCTNLTTLDLSSFDTSNVTNMSFMFSVCSNLTTLDLSSFDTSKVTDMMQMFYNCSNLTTLDLSSFDTSKVTDMMQMFYNCSNLTTIKGVIDMKSCTSFFSSYFMFTGCYKLTGVKIKNPPADFESKSGLSSSQYTIVS